MDESLGEVAEECAASLIDLLGVEPDVVGQPDQLLHQLGRLDDATGPGERRSLSFNAVVDALSDLGITHIDMPATPESVWAAIRNAETRMAAE